MMPPAITLAVLTVLHALVACWAVRSLWPRAGVSRPRAALRRTLAAQQRRSTKAPAARR